MAFAIKSKEPLSGITLLIVVNLLVAGAFLFLCYSCLNQWNEIVSTAMMVGVQAPIVDFMLPFFRVSLMMTMVCAFLMLIALAGLFCCFTVGRAVIGDEKSDLIKDVEPC